MGDKRYPIDDLSWLDLSSLPESSNSKRVVASGFDTLAGCWMAFDVPQPHAIEPNPPTYQHIIDSLLRLDVHPDEINKRMRVSYSGAIQNIASHHPGQTVHMIANFSTNAQSVEELVALLNASAGFHEMHGVDFEKIFYGHGVTLLSGNNSTACPNPNCSQDWDNRWRISIFENPYMVP